MSGSATPASAPSPPPGSPQPSPGSPGRSAGWTDGTARHCSPDEKKECYHIIISMSAMVYRKSQMLVADTSIHTSCHSLALIHLLQHSYIPNVQPDKELLN